MNFSPPPTGHDISRRASGQRRTTQALQLDTAEQTAEQYYFELLSQLGETRGRPTGHEFLACRSKNRGSFENLELLTIKLLRELMPKAPVGILVTREIRIPTAKRAREPGGAPPQMRLGYNSMNAGPNPIRTDP